MQLRGRLADELGVVAEMAARVHRRAERLEVLGLERLDDLRHRRACCSATCSTVSPSFLAARPQSRADAGSVLAAIRA